jgi:low temperature requirement protein LtrA
METEAPREIEPELEDEEESEHPVTPLELFFDLVFVFALTQVTGFMSDDPTWEGIGRGMLILAALWWAWGAYAWLTNEIDPNEGSARVAMFGSMAAMFVAALAVPHAFDTDAVLFGLAYFAVRVLHIVLFAEATPHVGVRQATFRLARTAIPGPALLIVAGFVDGWAEIALWLAALTIDYSGPYVFGVRGFVVSAGHFAERYALIVIIALGESIVAIGLAAVDLERDEVFVLAVAVSFAGAAAAWWAYFDFVQLASERRLRAAPEEKRGPLARDVYTFFHYPLVLGIVFLAVAAKKTLDGPTEPLSEGGRAALGLGLSLFVLGFVLARLRVIRRIAWERIGAAGVVVVAVLVLDDADAVVLLALSVLALVAALAVEAFRLREVRAQLHTR